MYHVAQNRRGNFVRQSTSDHQRLPYDYLSLMHYGRTAFGSGRETIRPRGGQMIGQRQRLSMYDILQINIRYCPGKLLCYIMQIVGILLYRKSCSFSWR